MPIKLLTTAVRISYKMPHCMNRYPILRIVGVAATLAAWAAAAFLTGYRSRLTPVGGLFAGKLLPGALALHSMRLAELCIPICHSGVMEHHKHACMHACLGGLHVFSLQGTSSHWDACQNAVLVFTQASCPARCCCRTSRVRSSNGSSPTARQAPASSSSSSRLSSSMQGVSPP